MLILSIDKRVVNINLIMEFDHFFVNKYLMLLKFLVLYQ